MFLHKYIFYIVTALVIFASGIFAGWHLRGTELKIVDHHVVQEKVVTQTKTQVQYVPKNVITERIVYVDRNSGSTLKTETATHVEKTDVEDIVGKPDVTVKVNNKAITFNKTDDEKYALEKDKIELTQTSTIDMSINIPTTDKTKYFGVGPVVGFIPGNVSYAGVQVQAWSLTGQLAATTKGESLIEAGWLFRW